MKRRINVSLYLDIRYRLKSGKFPVKLQCSAKQGGKWRQMYLETGEELTREEWDRVNDLDVRGPLRKKREAILLALTKAIDIVRDSPFMTLDTLRALYNGGANVDELNVQFMYDQVIRQLIANDQFGNSQIYQSAANLFKDKRGAGLTLDVIDKDFLTNLEHELTLAPSTIGIYFRTLRAIYNKAIDSKKISRDLYPFGRRGYRIPTGTAFKRALSESELDKLLKYKPTSPAAERALDVWKFSYYAVGMNMVDIARLKRDMIQGDVFTYIRKKTARTERVSTPQTVYVLKEVERLLKAGGKDYIFDVLDGSESAKDERKTVNDWTKRVNKELKAIGEALGIGVTLTTYTARHTAVTVLVRSGVPLSDIKDMLGHSSIKTTESYVASLDIDTRINNAKKLERKLVIKKKARQK